MAKGTKQVRVSDDTLMLVRMYAGILQVQTGESVSDDKAIRDLFERFQEDLVRQMEDIKKEKGKK